MNQEIKNRISTQYKKSIQMNIKNILEGRCIVVDPSSGGHSSLPAIAVIEKGKIISLEEVEINPLLRRRGAYVGHRLRAIGKCFQTKYGEQKFDLLAIELIHYEPSANTVLKSFQQLNMSTGAVFATVNASYNLLMPPWEWHLLRPENYKKSDLGDVELMAKKMIQDAKKEKKKC